MKKSIVLFMFALLFSLVSCGKGNAENSSSVATQSDGNKNFVEILYFHGDVKCRNCYAMEKGVTQLLEEKFKNEVNDGKIIFKTIDITSAEGEKIADKYGITWSSLLVNNWKDGKEEVKDMTTFGMKTAAKDPEKFKEEIQAIIENYLGA